MSFSGLNKKLAAEEQLSSMSLVGGARCMTKKALKAIIQCSSHFYRPVAATKLTLFKGYATDVGAQRRIIQSDVIASKRDRTVPTVVCLEVLTPNHEAI